MKRLILAALAFAVTSLPGAAENGQARRQPASVVEPMLARSHEAGFPIESQTQLVTQYCVVCHNDLLKTGGLTLAGFDASKVVENAEVAEKVIRKVRAGMMPPPGAKRPDAGTMRAFVEALETVLDRAAAAAPNPGRVHSHRLNRTEYVNAIYDLLALEIDGAALLPSDLPGLSFDNDADVLTITPALMARYMTAATKISRLALASADNRPTMQEYRIAGGGHKARQTERMGEDLPFATHGGLSARHTFPLDGEYVFKLVLKRVTDQINVIVGIEEDEHEIELRVDHALVKRFKIGGKFKGADPGTLIAPDDDDIEGLQRHQYRTTADNELEVRLPVRAGTRLVAVAFTDALPSALDEGDDGGSRNGGGGGGPGTAVGVVGLSSLRITGPFNGRVPEDTPSRQRIFVCRPVNVSDEEPCARQIISTLARRAYRRPVTESDVQPLLSIYKEGRSEQTFDAGIERALEAMLSSPEFLIRIERQPADASSGGTYRISDLELASRLSFFLWKSIPDDELLDVGARGKLKDPAILEQQVRRMLADRRATRFMNDFIGQWLQVRNLHSHQPDPRLFADFDETLREAMLRETMLFFESQVREDRPIQELLRANYTYLNERLAEHYGITNIYGSHFRRVTLTDERRFGLLGQGSVLTVTSYADRTSVVVRGKWILDNLLGAPPPPPPPNVPPLMENTPNARPSSLRERMEQHRTNPVCSTCHSRMDPLGFALEHFDAIGKWRETDAGADINSTVVLSDKTIDSPTAFREALLVEGDGEFVRTVTEKLLTYALSREANYADAPVVRQIGRDLALKNFRWSSLVLGIIKSPPFRMKSASGRADLPQRAETPVEAR